MPHRSVHQDRPAVDDEDARRDGRSIHDALKRELRTACRRLAADGNEFVLDAWFDNDITRNPEGPLGVQHAVPVIDPPSHIITSRMRRHNARNSTTLAVGRARAMPGVDH
jgi:hypothetical protein